MNRINFLIFHSTLCSESAEKVMKLTKSCQKMVKNPKIQILGVTFIRHNLSEKVVKR